MLEENVCLLTIRQYAGVWTDVFGDVFPTNSKTRISQQVLKKIKHIEQVCVLHYMVSSGNVRKPKNRGYLTSSVFLPRT